MSCCQTGSLGIWLPMLKASSGAVQLFSLGADLCVKELWEALLGPQPPASWELRFSSDQHPWSLMSFVDMHMPVGVSPSLLMTSGLDLTPGWWSGFLADCGNCQVDLLCSSHLEPVGTQHVSVKPLPLLALLLPLALSLPFLSEQHLHLLPSST